MDDSGNERAPKSHQSSGRQSKKTHQSGNEAATAVGFSSADDGRQTHRRVPLMPRRVSRESFEQSRSPRLGRSGFESRLKPYLEDVILLVLQHYTAPQIREWLTEYKRVEIGRHAVGRFVKRIQAVVDNIDKEPATRTGAVLAEAIRKAVASRPGQALLPAKPTRSLAETSGRNKRRAVIAQKAAADDSAIATLTGAPDSPREIQCGRLPEPTQPAGAPAPCATSSRLIPSRDELDRKSAQAMQAAGKPQLMSSAELARMIQDIEDEAGNNKRE